MRARGEGWSGAEALLVLLAQVQHNTTRAVVAMGAKSASQIPKPLQIPVPNRPQREPFTRHDWRRALTPPRR